MRQMNLKWSDRDFSRKRQEVTVTAHCLLPVLILRDYLAVRRVRNYQAYERLQSRKGIVKEVKETPRGFYTVVEFDEDEPT